MERRDVLKGLGLSAAAVTTVAATTETAEAQAAEAPQLGPYTEPWNPPDEAFPNRQNIVRVPDDYFIPGRFAGKTAIVTGCARGMGRLAAVRLAREGANVVGVDWLEDEGRAVIDGIAAEGGAATFVAGDISEDAVCAEMVRVAADTYGGLDVALNNAGVMDAIFPGDEIDYATQASLTLNPIHEASDDYWHVVMRVNATGTFYSMRHELRQFLAQGRGGSIVNVASVTGLRGFGGTPSYVASKHAVNGLTKNAAIDYAPFGIRVNSVCMGTTLTPMVERAFALLSQRAQTGFRDTGIGMAKIRSLAELSDQKQRGSTAAEQVAVMLFLLSPESSNLTGANYATDGGFTTY
ncbi:SDR family NAD(P)-dependent oxidoreductase [Rubellimicrobium roseum]|uniref:SDR family NAD(P)-dependent oxidoreductase n=1 Tax=Rubellimicrobium roseum TaxID=687525 RepID=A0A5C4N5Z5_9RHOB|nr:SDR family NAD(P)-dependent oxidoreductase [Rubellimicrobium roseum]TNC65384.1 SDR family NAD(P)-dependent oxidoreductase [Rubellimicrobium roseum]